MAMPMRRLVWTGLCLAAFWQMVPHAFTSSKRADGVQPSRILPLRHAVHEEALHAFHSTPPLVLDAVHIVPPLPVDDVLLTDLNHSDLSRPFGIWAMAEDTDQSPPQTRVEITASQRLLVLLRVTVETPAKGYSTTKKTFNVPFLLDTGSPQSFMCQEDYNKLGLDSARNVYIEGCAVNVRKSTEHFEDINLLGTDVLRKTSLFVNYTAGVLHLGFFDQGPSAGSAGSAVTTSTSVVWVRELIRKDGKVRPKQRLKEDGKEFQPTGSVFQVKGALSNVDDLKKAIRKEKPKRVTCDADEIDIYSQKEDGKWEPEEKMSASLRNTDEEDYYGFVVPSDDA